MHYIMYYFLFQLILEQNEIWHYFARFVMIAIGEYSKTGERWDTSCAVEPGLRGAAHLSKAALQLWHWSCLHMQRLPSLCHPLQSAIYAEKKRLNLSVLPSSLGVMFFWITHMPFLLKKKQCISPSHTSLSLSLFLSLSSAAGFSEFSAPPPPLSGGTQSNSVSTALKQLNICLESGPRTAFLLCCTIRTLNPSLPTFALHPSGPITSFFHLLVSPLCPPQDTLRCFLNSFPCHVHLSLRFILLLSPFQNLLLSLFVFSWLFFLSHPYSSCLTSSFASSALSSICKV